MIIVQQETTPEYNKPKNRFIIVFHEYQQVQTKNMNIRFVSVTQLKK